MLSQKSLPERILGSELGQKWLNDSLMNQDIWSVKQFGYTEEESTIRKTRNIYFDSFSLPWLKLLAKLTALASAREKCSLGTLKSRVNNLKLLDKFLISQGYSQPEILTEALLEEFIAQSEKSRRTVIAYVAKLWADEQWLKLPYTHRRYKQSTPKVETIPEEVLAQIYENFDRFPAPLERLFRLQLVLGCRLGEMLKMPRQCLKQEGDRWFLLRWVQKRQHWRFYRVHPLVAELVREQQRFLEDQFGRECDFDKLFCKVSTSSKDGVSSKGNKFEKEPAYIADFLSEGIIGQWLRDFSQKADLKDQHGNRFHLTSHHFRRTKASIMAYCEAEDEYIAAVLGHS